MSERHLPNLFNSLRKLLNGEVYTDRQNRILYSTDASIYQQLPLAVVRPKHRDDCVKLVQFAREHQLPLIPRAAGTSLAGQVVGDGIVVDTSRHMHNIVEIDVEQQTARVQPGVVLDILNQQTRKFGLQFAPNPSSSSRCTISGVIGNNAWGAHYPLYGSTREHLHSIDNILSDGSIAQFSSRSAQELSDIDTSSSFQSKLEHFVKTAVDSHRDKILQCYPSIEQVPCNMGYPFHVLAQSQPWNIQGPLFNMARFICGSEGTLSLITEACVKLVPIPRFRHMVCCHFDTMQQALHAVSIAVKQNASAVELLDNTIISMTKTNLEQSRNRKWIKGDPDAILLVEFCGDNASELADITAALISELSKNNLGYHYSQLVNEQTNQAWAIRKAGLGLLMGSEQHHKPVTFIEDSAVPVEKLPEFIAAYHQLIKKYQVDSVYYGSVSTGLIHLRPILNLKLHRDRPKLVAIANDVAELIKSFGGTMSAKHGDGIIRSHYIKTLLGDDIYQLIAQTKQQFDPDNIFNPHKIIDAYPIDKNLRSDHTATHNINTFLDWTPSQGIMAAVESCNGAGVCRKPAGNGVMCPSYMVTLEEQHSTRGRANTIRQMIAEHGFEQGIIHPNVKEALQLCLSCKGCRSECPANVDMTRLKIEHLQHYIKAHGTPLRAHVMRAYEYLSKIGTTMPAVANFMMNSHFFRSLLGYDARRKLPTIQRQTLSNWFAHHTIHPNAGKLGEVIVLNNVFVEFYDVKVAVAAIEFLEYCGYAVNLSPCFPSVRTVLSQGLVDAAKFRLNQIIKYLYPKATYNFPVIGLEPSELLTLRDDAKALVVGDQISQLDTVMRQTLLFEEFVSMERYKIESQDLEWKARHITILLHVHCHQKALVGIDPCHDALSIIPECGIQVIPSGCCGMAGSFGYEKENYAFSLRIANLILFPSIRNASKDTIIVATGTSCRHQIRGNIDVEPLHPAEVLRSALLL